MSTLRRSPHALLQYAVIAFALGIAFGSITPCRSDTLFWIIAMVMAGSIITACRRQLHGPALVFLLLFLFTTGIIHIRPHVMPPASPYHIYNLITRRQPGSLTGTLIQLPLITDADSSRPRTRLLMAVNTLRRPRGPSLVSDSTAGPATGLVQLTLNGLPPPDLKPGDAFMARAVLSRVDSYAVPGAFDYKRFLANKAIWVTGWIQSPVHVVRLYSLMERPLWELPPSVRYIPEQIRYRLAIFLNAILPPETAGLYKAILIGDRTGISPRILEDFKTAGCIHILAISGLHIGLLALILIGGISWLLKRSTWAILHLPIRKTATLLSLLPLTIYALIAGFNPPVVRALVMTYALIAGIFFDRQKSIMNNIAIAAFFILIWQPASLLSVSFQLSFSAVVGIAMIYPRISRLLSSPRQKDASDSQDHASADEPAAVMVSPDQAVHRFSFWRKLAEAKWFHPGLTSITNRIKAGLLIALAAYLGTAALSIFYFNRISLVGPVANLLIEPLVCFWSLVIGLLACCTLPFSANLAGVLFHLGSFGLQISAQLAAWLATLPFAEIWLATPSGYEIIAYYVLLFALLYTSKGQPGWQTGKKSLVLLVAVFLVLFPAYKKFKRTACPDTTVSVLDVGQGSSTLLELPHGKAILLDGGGWASPRFDVGERLIAPFLWKLRYRRLEAVIISHPHADHYNGLFFILKRFRPRQMWINGQQGNDPAYGRLLRLAGYLGVEIKICRPGALLYESGASSVTCIANQGWQKETGGRVDGEMQEGEINRASLVIRLEHRGRPQEKGIAFLFPGDIDDKGEAELMNSAKNDLAVDVLLSPHHGSKLSNPEEFLTAVSPKYVVVSAGSGFGSYSRQPHSLEGFCRQHGIVLLTTARDGSVSFTTNNGALSVKLLRPQ